ncbi:MAG: glycosyltransferase family 1 protein [Chloroflexota bacterium]
MRLAINALFLDHARTGTGVYTRNVLEVLGEVAPARGHRLLAYGTTAPKDAPPAGPAPALLPTPFDRRADNLAKLWFEQVALPHASRRARADLLYAPYFSLPVAQAGRGVITVHDMIPLLLPEYAPSRPVQAYFRLVTTAARRAAAVITVSEHARVDIGRLLGVAPERVHVAYEGTEARFRPVDDAVALDTVRRRYGLPEQFALYLGGGDRRKNVGVLLDALALPGSRGVPPLVVVAPARDSYSPLFPDWRGHAARLGLGERVRFVDWVDEADKPALYAAATVFCFPSVYEGFGLPPLEAMACGTPVLCSQATSLPEVVGSAGILLDPADPAAWAEALMLVCGTESHRRDLAARGLRQAARFSWQAMGERVLDILEEVGNAR